MLSDVSTPAHNLADLAQQDDRREDPRVSMRGTVFVIPQGDPLARFWATTANISRGGFFVQSVMTLPPEAQLRARIHLEDGPVIRAQARVAREQAGKGFGCYFTGFSPGAARELARWLGPTGGLAPVTGTID